jgi:hypothetical protein
MHISKWILLFQWPVFSMFQKYCSVFGSVETLNPVWICIARIVEQFFFCRKKLRWRNIRLNATVLITWHPFFRHTKTYFTFLLNSTPSDEFLFLFNDCRQARTHTFLPLLKWMIHFENEAVKSLWREYKKPNFDNFTLLIWKWFLVNREANDNRSKNRPFLNTL